MKANQNEDTMKHDTINRIKTMSMKWTNEQEQTGERNTNKKKWRIYIYIHKNDKYDK